MPSVSWLVIREFTRGSAGSDDEGCALTVPLAIAGAVPIEANGTLVF